MKSSDFASLVSLAEERGYASLFDYAETARQDFLFKFGKETVFDFEAMLSKPEWLLYWYPEVYHENFERNILGIHARKNND